jgi:hypothetical protein
MSAAFGDLEPDDVWDDDPTIAPEQVAYKLHRLRRAVEQLAGRDPGRFDDLSRRDRYDALELGQAVTDYAVANGTADAARAARAIHDLFRPQTGGPLWVDLSDDEQAIGVALVAIIFTWLRRQGPR